MIRNSPWSGLATLALTSLMAACGGSDRSTPPQNASTTTTTAYSWPLPPSDTTIEPTTPEPNPAMAPGNTQTTGPVPTIGQSGQLDLQLSNAVTASLNDSQIVAALGAANASEADEARVATKKANSPSVRQFAEGVLLQSERGEGELKSVTAGQSITPQEGPVSDQFAQDGEHTLLSLRAGNATDFDRAYLDAQTDEQKKLFQLVERSLTQVQNASLKAYLQGRRQKALDRMAALKDVQASLPAKR